MTTDTTNWPCPVDGSPCWRDRECPHVKDGVKACVVKGARAATFDTPDPWRVEKTPEGKG